jgi:hypothetical protein
MAVPNVELDGNRIILHFDRLEDALRLLSPWREARTRADVASRIHEALNAVGLAVELRVKGRPVAELGEGEARGSLLSLVLGVISAA